MAARLPERGVRDNRRSRGALARAVLLVLHVLALVVSAGPALAQSFPDDVIDARGFSVVPVPAGEARVLDVGPFDDVIVLDATHVTVTPLGDGRIEVVSLSRVGRADLMLLTAQGTRPLVVRVVAPERVPRPSRSADAGFDRTLLPELVVGGGYGVVGSGQVTRLVLSQSLDWYQPLRSGHVGFGAAVNKVGSQPFFLSRVLGELEGRTYDVAVGDVPFGPRGVGWGFAPRGVGAEWTPPGSQLVLQATAGTRKPVGCCAVIDSDGPLVFGATAQWMPGVGHHALAGAGAFTDRGAVVPFVSGAWGFRLPLASVDIMATRSGAGSGYAVLGSVHPDRRVVGFLAAQFLEQGYQRPGQVELPNAQALVRSHASVALGERVSVYGDLGVRHVLSDRPKGQVSAGAGVSGRLPTGTYLGLGVRRLSSSFVPDGPGGNSFSMRLTQAVGPRVLAQLQSTAGTQYQGDARFSLLASTQVSLAEAWRTRFSYGLRASKASDPLQHSASVEISARGDVHSGAFRTRISSGVGPVRSDTSGYYAVQIGRFGSIATEASLSFGAVASWYGGVRYALSSVGFGQDSGRLGLRGQVRGVAFVDVDRDGTYEPAVDTAASGLEVSLDGRGTLITGVDGSFVFTAVPAGQHTVDLARGDFHPLDGTQRYVKVGPGVRPQVLFPLQYGGAVLGEVYQDLDGDRTFGPGDAGVAVDAVVLRDVDGRVAATAVPLYGRFEVRGLAPGHYRATIDPFSVPEGYQAVDPTEQDLEVVAGANRITFRFDSTRAIGGRVWLDVDEDGRPAGRTDLPLPDVEVRLDGGRVARTDEQGRYLFRDVPPGDRTVWLPLSGERRTVDVPSRPTMFGNIDFAVPTATSAAPAPSPAPVREAGADRVVGVVVAPRVHAIPAGMSIDLRVTGIRGTGESIQLGEDVSWASSDPSVATIDAAGHLVAVAPGVADISASWTGISGMPVSVTVLSSTLTSLEVFPAKARVRPSGSLDFVVVATDDEGRTGDVSLFVAFESTDPGVAIVDHSRLRGLTEGTAEVTGALLGTHSAPVPVVVGGAPINSLTVGRVPPRMPPGAQMRLEVLGYRTDLGVEDVSGEVHYESSDPSVLSVEEDGTLRALKAGLARVIVRLGTLEESTTEITVSSVPPRSVIVTPASVRLTVGQTTELRATAVFETGQRAIVTPVVTWTVDGRGITLEPNGTLIGAEAGSALVTATLNGVSSEPVEVIVEP